jgi:hypothetical protein
MGRRGPDPYGVYPLIVFEIYQGENIPRQPNVVPAFKRRSDGVFHHSPVDIDACTLRPPVNTDPSPEIDAEQF